MDRFSDTILMLSFVVFCIIAMFAILVQTCKLHQERERVRRFLRSRELFKTLATCLWVATKEVPPNDTSGAREVALDEAINRIDDIFVELGEDRTPTLAKIPNENCPRCCKTALHTTLRRKSEGRPSDTK